MTERLIPIYIDPPLLPFTQYDDRYFFTIHSPVPIDDVKGFIYNPQLGPDGTVSEDHNTLDMTLRLRVPPGDFEFQILGYYQGRVVAGLHGPAHALVDGQFLQLIAATLPEES